MSESKACWGLNTGYVVETETSACKELMVSEGSLLLHQCREQGQAHPMNSLNFIDSERIFKILNKKRAKKVHLDIAKQENVLQPLHYIIL